MRILQFAFAGDASDRYLPHHHTPDSVVYTGTHDNNTTVGWWGEASDHERHHARAYLGTDGHDIAWAMMRAAAASVADTVIHPMQTSWCCPAAPHEPARSGRRLVALALRLGPGAMPGTGQRLADMTRLFGRA